MVDKKKRHAHIFSPTHVTCFPRIPAARKHVPQKPAAAAAAAAAAAGLDGLCVSHHRHATGRYPYSGCGSCVRIDILGRRMHVGRACRRMALGTMQGAGRVVKFCRMTKDTACWRPSNRATTNTVRRGVHAHGTTATKLVAQMNAASGGVPCEPQRGGAAHLPTVSGGTRRAEKIVGRNGGATRRERTQVRLRSVGTRPGAKTSGGGPQQVQLTSGAACPGASISGRLLREQARSSAPTTLGTPTARGAPTTEGAPTSLGAPPTKGARMTVAAEPTDVGAATPTTGLHSGAAGRVGGWCRAPCWWSGSTS